MNINNRDRFGYINDFDGRMSLSSSAIPTKYLDAVKKYAKELKYNDIHQNNTLSTDEEYYQNAYEIIKDKVITPEILEYAERLKYKHEHENEEGKTTYSDEFYLDIAAEKFRVRDDARIAGSIAKLLNIKNPVPDEDWAGYSYEEIINMADDGFYVPKEVLEWAQGQKDADVISYIILNDEINDSSSTADVSNDTDVNAQQKIERKFIEKSEEKQKLIKEKLEEIKAYERAVQNLKAKSNTQASILKQIQHDVAEWKILDAKKNRGGLTPSELERYNELQQTVQDSATSQDIAKNSKILENYVLRIETLNDECVDAKTIIQELSNLSLTNSQTVKNSNVNSTNVDAVKGSKISVGSGNASTYGITSGDVSVLSVQSVSDLESVVSDVKNYIAGTSDLVSFAEKYYEELNNISINLESRNSGAIPVSDTKKSDAVAQVSETNEENKLADSAANDVGFDPAVHSLASAGIYAVQAAAVALISSGVFPSTGLSLIGILAGMTVLHKIQTKQQEKAREKVADDSKSLENAILQTNAEVNKMTSLVKSLEAMFNKNTKQSDSLMKQLVKLFGEQTKIDQEDTKEKEKSAQEQVQEIQEIKYNDDGTPQEPKIPEGQKDDKKAETKKKSNGKKIDRITKQVGNFSKENKEISEKINQTTPQIQHLNKQNNSAAKKLDITNKLMALTSVPLALTSTGRMVDGAAYTALGATGLVCCGIVAGIGIGLLCSPFTAAAGKYLLKCAAKAAPTCFGITATGVASIKSAVDGFKEVGKSMSQFGNTNDTLSEEKSTSQDAQYFVSNSVTKAKDLKELTTEKDKVDNKSKAKGKKDVKKAEQEKKKVVKTIKKTLKDALKQAKMQVEEINQQKMEEQTANAEGGENTVSNEQVKTVAQAASGQSNSANPMIQNNEGQTNNQNQGETQNTTVSQDSNSSTESESENSADTVEGSAVAGSASESAGTSETAAVEIEDSQQTEQTQETSTVSQADIDLGNLIKLYLVAKVSELNVSQELKNKISHKFDTSKFVSAIKERIADGQDIQEAIEDVVIEKLNSMDIDSMDNTPSQAALEDKYGEKQRERSKAYFTSKVRHRGQAQGSAPDAGEVNPFSSNNIFASQNNNQTSSANENTNSVADPKEKQIIEKTDDVISAAGSIQTPEINVDEPEISKTEISNNIETASSLQNELEELENDADHLKGDKSRAKRRINIAKDLISAILNRQIGKMKTLAADSGESTDSDDMPIVSANTENEEVTKSAASSMISLSENNNTGDNADKKLSKFNADSIEDLRRKNKKVLGVKAYSHRRSR